jgi:transcriptional regulator with XRE-family HTH domain
MNQDKGTRLVRGAVIKAIRERKGLTQEQLGEKTKYGRSFIASVEQGIPEKIDQSKYKKIASELSLTTEELDGIVNAEPDKRAKLIELMAGRTVREPGATFKRGGGFVRLKIRGYVPCGIPFVVEQLDMGEDIIETEALRGCIKPDECFTLIASGNSLSGDKIYDGQHVIVDPNQKEVTAFRHVYIVRIRGNECSARHVKIHDGTATLVSSNAQAEDINTSELEVLGRITYHWYPGEWLT